MKTQSLETQSSMTPSTALRYLKEGNDRFVNNLKASRNLLKQVNETREGQWPFAVMMKIPQWQCRAWKGLTGSLFVDTMSGW